MCIDKIFCEFFSFIFDLKFFLYRFERNFVRLGEHDLSTEKDGKHQDIDVVGARKHESYVKDAGINDIALVYLKKDVTFTERIAPICLPISPSMQERNFVGMNPFIAGWGRLKEGGERATVLQVIFLVDCIGCFSH